MEQKRHKKHDNDHWRLLTTFAETFGSFSLSHFISFWFCFSYFKSVYFKAQLMWREVVQDSNPRLFEQECLINILGGCIEQSIYPPNWTGIPNQKFHGNQFKSFPILLSFGRFVNFYKMLVALYGCIDRVQLKTSSMNVYGL